MSERPFAVHDLPADAYPFTIRIFSGKDGSELWSRRIERPSPEVRSVVEIPGYGHTEHYPVRVQIEWPDGTTDIALP